MNLPEKTGKDTAHKVAKIGANLIPFVGGSIAETFDALVTPPFEKRREEWMQMVHEKLLELQEKDEGKLNELINNEEFQSLLISSTIIAYRTHQKEKKEKLRNGLINSGEHQGRFELNEQYLNFINDLSLSHIGVLSFIKTNQDKMHGINSVSKFYGVCADGSLGDVLVEIEGMEISAFRFLLKDLESKGLLMLSSDLIDLSGHVYEGSSLSLEQNETMDLPFIRVTQFGIDFIDFIVE